MNARLLISAIVVIYPLSAAAQDRVLQTDEERAFYKAQFADWGGIVFRCELSDKSNRLEAGLCSRASEDARFLAASAKIPFKSVGTEPYYVVGRASAELNHALVLTAQIHSLVEPLAVHIRLEAASVYSAAVDLNESAGTPESKPRGGTLSLWETGLMGGGGGSPELEQSLARDLESLIKKFLSLYLESRQFSE